MSDDKSKRLEISPFWLRFTAVNSDQGRQRDSGIDKEEELGYPAQTERSDLLDVDASINRTSRNGEYPLRMSILCGHGRPNPKRCAADASDTDLRGRGSVADDVVVGEVA